MEDQKARVDRELKELLEEIRVLVPGVQLLGALLLTVAFTERFSKFTSGERIVYFVGFSAAIAATVFLVAPSAHHRLLWRQPNKEFVLKSAHVMALLATPCMAISMGCVSYLVGSVVYGQVAANVAVGIAVAAMVLLWWGLPVVGRVTTHDSFDREASNPAAGLRASGGDG
jgi:hypothetical protein